MKITILGSGGVLGVPVWSCDCDVCTKETLSDKRNIRTRPAIMVNSKGKTIVVDMGQDFRQQMLKEKVKKIDYLLLTHTHMDHTSSLAELRAGGNVHFESPEEVFEKLNKTREVMNYLKSRNPDIQMGVFEPKKIGDVFVDMIRVTHEKDYTGENEPTVGFLFTEKNKKAAYLPDAGEIIDMEKLKELDVFICDGTTFETKWGHIGIEGGIRLYKELKPKLMIFTHITHDKSHKELEKYVNQFGNIKVAYDGMVIEI